MNKRCEEWSVASSELGPYDEQLIGEFRKSLYNFFNPYGMPLLGLAGIEAGVDFGPGVSPGARGTSYLDKIGHSKLTAPNQLTIDLFYQWVRSHPLSVDVEIARLVSCGAAEVVESVKITPVPKTAKISRLVKPEPLLGMFFQKGIQRVLEWRLKDYFGIDLKEQPGINRLLARKGSVNTGPYTFSTMDLTSASDCIALSFCEAFLPREAVNWLKAFRSKEATLPDGSQVELHMIATMGNAYCFPLQTAIFACAVQASYSCLGIPFERTEIKARFERDPDTGEVTGIVPERKLANWGVFGDDIICRHDAYATLSRLLRAVGFLPNSEKSFDSPYDPFRESCGGDYFHGHDVRGVYCKSLKTQQDKYALINSLVDWSARHDLPLVNTIQALYREVQRVEIPPWENPDAGIRMPLSCIRTSGVFQASDDGRNPSRPNYQGSYLYKRWVPREKALDVSDEMHAREIGYWNSSAIFECALKGVLRGGRVCLLQWDTPYIKRIGVAPCWDYFDPGSTKMYIMRWKRMCERYFGA